MTQSKHEHQYRSSESFDVSHETTNDAIENTHTNTEVITTEAVVHAYDDVAPDESHPDDNTIEIKAHPVRKAPEPPTAGKSMKTQPSEETPEQLEEGMQSHRCIASQNALFLGHQVLVFPTLS